MTQLHRRAAGQPARVKPRLQTTMLPSGQDRSHSTQWPAGADNRPTLKRRRENASRSSGS